MVLSDNKWSVPDGELSPLRISITKIMIKHFLETSLEDKIFEKNLRVYLIGRH
jgi:hypothetical protein